LNKQAQKTNETNKNKQVGKQT